ncbi:choline kinase family protein [Histophilus somni]|uniref:Phosphotransferase n=3 Tax=Histophilus somni TaxID=731 RepID=A0A9Q7E753_HISSO|nr:choline kinase family protein [Histophilus somni]QEH11547.1 phosphotransferase [Histophilus somni]QEH15229.1 phosphotransferase [Histophilus somni]QEH15549.1 phosphotransferase [Histophilus somni]QEH20634.1 phosphotransferase [Histophilus somni]QEH22421.1 phosphotransferase [Histophilus somni]
MTNKNYLLHVDNEKYVLRLPGVMTSNLISRHYEMNNSILMSQAEFNVETIYFNADNGIKITKFLEKGINFNHNNIHQYEYLSLISKELYKLHHSDIQFNNEFNVFETFQQYFDLLKDKNGFFCFNKNIQLIYEFFLKISKNNSFYNIKCPCHNDLVPENILMKNNKLFFIDWEYSGMNAPLFDVAAFFLESRIPEEKQKYFLAHYDHHLDFENSRMEILFHQFTQDVLWFLWTLIKEENNETFENYASIRINRAYELMKELMKNGFI